MTLNLARDPFIKQTSSFVILGAKRIDRVNVNETYLLDSHWVRSRITSPGYHQLDHVTTPHPRSYYNNISFVASSFCMVRLQLGAIIDILESNFTGNCSWSAVIVANPFVACYNNLTVWDSFAASLSDTENCLTIHFFWLSPRLSIATSRATSCRIATLAPKAVQSFWRSLFNGVWSWDVWRHVPCLF